MAYQVPTQLPDSLAAGTTWTWRRRLVDFVGTDGWTVVAHAVGAETRLDIPGTSGAEGWTFEAPAEDTAAIVPGRYRVTLVATRGAERRQVEVVETTITADPIAGEPGAGLSYDERMIRAIEAELERRLTGQAVASYSVGGRSLQYESMEVLQRQLAAHKAAVRTARGIRPAPVLIAFGGRTLGAEPGW